MKLKSNCSEFYNDISESIRAFEEVDRIEETEENADITVIKTTEENKVSAVCVYGDARGECSDSIPNTETEAKRTEKRCVKLAVYRCMKEKTGKNLPWGSLTGIRPTKLLREFGGDREVLEKVYDLPKEKTELLEKVCNNQKEYFNLPEGDIDIYVGIPFCRTRCSYCSFSSTDSVKGEKLMRPYVDALVREIKETSLLLNKLGKRIRCVYIGGGTPTALPDGMFAEMMEAVSENFKPYLEFTVEAGRPDTINVFKLQKMKDCNVDRISINPQSMNEETLKKIGRSHSPEEIVKCFEDARKIGFKTVNADLIAGLPDETEDEFFNTLSRVLELEPENITVHTLALKRGSVLFEKGYRPDNGENVRKMVEGAYVRLSERGYEPYYLYRQKYMTGNFENIGYTLKGHTGVYNIDIMEETADIIALGCGAVSKAVKGDRIERAFNFKSIYEYNSRIEECIERKKLLFEDSI